MTPGFLRAERGRLVDAAGTPVLLRGVGLGNWLLPEGYMWRFFPPAPQSPRQIETLIVDLVGEEDAADFWRRFRDRWISERDIEAIAAAGMNHIRLPISARVVIADDGTILDDGIALVDRLIDWCRTQGLWVVLDLHGAPGGQTGTNIDDSPNGMPELFDDQRHRDLTVALWRALAERYRDDTCVAGYDLLNEPLPDPYGELHSQALVALYRDLTRTIREVDQNHLIIYEGTHWASKWDIFTEVWDDNSALSFHKYWSPPDRGSITAFLERRDTLGLPIYMGEGGENDVGWLQAAFGLYDDLEISWNFWPWKKIETLSSPCSVTAPEGWDAIVSFGHGGPRPAAGTAAATLNALLDAMRFDDCVYRREIVSALRRVAPVDLSAAAFGFQGAGRSYQTANATPFAAFRSDDHVTLRPVDVPAAGLSFDYADEPDRQRLTWQVELGAGDWVGYEFGVERSSELLITVACERAPDASLELSIGQVRLEGTPTPHGWSARTRVPLLPAGRHQLRVAASGGSVVLRSISVEPPRG